MIATACALRGGVDARDVLTYDSPMYLLKYAIKYNPGGVITLTHSLDLLMYAIKYHCAKPIPPHEITELQFRSICAINRNFYKAITDTNNIPPQIVSFLINHGIHICTISNKYMGANGTNYITLCRNTTILPHHKYTPPEYFSNAEFLLAAIGKLGAHKYILRFAPHLLQTFAPEIEKQNPLAYYIIVKAQILPDVKIDMAAFFTKMINWCHIPIYYNWVQINLAPRDQTLYRHICKTKIAQSDVSSYNRRDIILSAATDNTRNTLPVAADLSPTANRRMPNIFSYAKFERMINADISAFRYVDPIYLRQFIEWYNSQIIRKLAILSAATNPARTKTTLVVDVADIIAEMYLDSLLLGR
jgi:hypothetical protein